MYLLQRVRLAPLVRKCRAGRPEAHYTFVLAPSIQITLGRASVKEQKTVAISFRVSPTFKRCLTEAALRARRSQTNLIEYLVFSYCELNGLLETSIDGKRSSKSKKQRRQG
jgi:hypothetical protein